MSTFYVPDQFAGKTLNQIRNEGNYAFRPDVIGGENVPLTAGQNISYKDDPGSGEFQFLQKYFTPQDVFQQQQQQSQLQEFEATEQRRIQEREKALSESIGHVTSQLESEKAPLHERYNKLIEQIRGQREKSVEEADITKTREFGRRGLPISSTVVQEELDKQRLGVREEFAGKELEAEFGLADRLTDISRLVAQLKASVTPQAFEQAMSQVSNLLNRLQISESGRQFDVSVATQREQFGQTLGLQQQGLDLQRQTAAQPNTTIQTIGGRVKLLVIDPTTGQPTKTIDLGSSSSGTGGLSATQKQSLAQDVLNKASGGANHTDLQRDYGSKLGTDNVTELYNSVSPYGEHNVASSTQAAVRNISGQPYVINPQTGEVIKKVTPEEATQTEQNIPWYKRAAQIFNIY